jgi:hypothetical protein
LVAATTTATATAATATATATATTTTASGQGDERGQVNGSCEHIFHEGALFGL